MDSFYWFLAYSYKVATTSLISEGQVLKGMPSVSGEDRIYASALTAQCKVSEYIAR